MRIPLNLKWLSTKRSCGDEEVETTFFFYHLFQYSGFTISWASGGRHNAAFDFFSRSTTCVHTYVSRWCIASLVQPDTRVKTFCAALWRISTKKQHGLCMRDNAREKKECKKKNYSSINHFRSCVNLKFYLYMWQD